MRAANSKRMRSGCESPSASARLCIVYLWGLRCPLRSRRLMVSTLSPARSAKSSCVRPAAFRCWRSRSPKTRCSPASSIRSPHVRAQGRSLHRGPAGARAMIARHQSIPETADIPNYPGDYPGDCTICRWKGVDITRMMEDRNYTTSAQRSKGQERRHPHVSRGE